MPDGTVKKRISGTPQGGMCSAIYANLYMHYSYDRWMVTQNQNNLWARYADDAVIHCRTKEEAEQLLGRLKKRLATCKLELHPEKTKIVSHLYAVSDLAAQSIQSHPNYPIVPVGYSP
jgi:RNA-directed DNA polymerase